MRPVTLTLVSQVADDNGICTSQMPGGAGDLTINGALASAGSVTLTTASYVAIHSDADDSGNTFTITGTGVDGAALSETVTGPSSATVNTVHRFLTITEVAISGAAVGNIIVGTSSYARSAPCPLDYHSTPFNVGLFFEYAGSTATFTAQYSGDDPWAYTDADDYNENATWFDHPFITDLAANLSGNIAFAVRAVRLISDEGGVATGTLNIVQSGL